MNEKLKKLCDSAMLAALCCVATLISIPISATKGYINLGDSVVIICGWLLGPGYGFAAAAIGSSLADVVLGYPIYAPATFIIKGTMALTAFFLYSVWQSKHAVTAFRLLSAVCAELVMIVGYYLFESLVLDYGFVVAAMSVPSNLIQALGGIVISATVMKLLIKSRKPIG